MFNGLYVLGFIVAAVVILATHLRDQNDLWRERHALEGEVENVA